MNKSDILSSIKVLLGYPVVTVFIQDEQISTLIDIAVRRCQSKACPTFITNVNANTEGIVDLTNLNVETVKTVYENSGSNSNVDIFSNLLPIAYSNGSGGGQYNNLTTLFPAMTNAGNISEMRKFIIPDFYFKDNKLYLDNYSGGVTIEYVKRSITFEDLDTEWAAWAEGYAVALTKITEGRIRLKYKLNNSPIEVESDNMVSEGQGEKSDFEAKLDSAMGYFNILR